MKEIQAYKVSFQEGILLNANELSTNLDESLIQEIKDRMDSILFNRYPDDRCEDLCKTYAQVMNVSQDQVLAGNGSDQILGLLIGLFLKEGKTLYTLYPDFGMYDYYCTNYEASIEKYVTEKDGSLDIDVFIKNGKEKDVSMILFSNPNNPTGHMISNQELIKILDSFDSIPVVIDEAYGEFAKESAIDLIDQYSNLYVTRTLSKAYGLAGARVGFLISQKENIQFCKENNVPYVLNSISQMVAQVVLEHPQYTQSRIQNILLEREKFYQKQYKNIRLFPSQANYIMVTCSNVSKLLDKLKEFGIVVREYPNKEYFRLTIGTKEENEYVQTIFDIFEKEESA